MPKNRLEAFSDGVIAIVITLLVLELRVPQAASSLDSSRLVAALLAMIPNFAAYVISFLVCAVWWVAHHNFVHELRYVDRSLLWVNNLFLLWLAFLPFPTALLGQDPDSPPSAAFYGMIGALTGLSFWFMRWYASRHPELMAFEVTPGERRRRLRVSISSPILYTTGVAVSFVAPVVAICIYAGIPLFFAFINLASNSARKHSTAKDPYEAQ